MRITPLDIRKQPFRKAVMGFDRDQVNAFLDQVAGEYETLNRQNDELYAELKVAKARLEGFEKIERTLNDTLLTAQKATDEARLNAQKEAELIIKDAQIRADRYEIQSRQRVNSLESDLMSLKTQRDSFLARFRSMLKDQLALLEIVSGSLKDNGGNRKEAAPREKVTGSSTTATDRKALDETMDEVPSQPNVAAELDGSI